MKSKLVTFGCSFTDSWPWPSWSDWMAYYYDDYEKLARGGTGNRAIFHSIVKYLSSKDSFINEQFVVQWSGIVREDRYDKQVDTPEYLGVGNILHNFKYDKEFVDEHFSFLQNTTETINYIYAAKHLLKTHKVNYVMTFMLDPRIDPFLGEPGFNMNFSPITKKESVKIKNELSRLTYIIDDKFTDSCITMHQLDNPCTVYSFINPETKKPMKDGHPGPSQHYTFFKKYISPKIPYKEFKENSKILNSVEEWDTYAKIVDSSDNKKHLEPKSWPTSKRWENGKLKKVKYSLKESLI